MEFEAYFLVVRAVSAKGLSPSSEMLLISLRQALNVPDGYHMECLTRLAEDEEFEALQNELAGVPAPPAPSAKPPKGRSLAPEPSVVSGAAKPAKKRLRPTDGSFPPAPIPPVPHILPPISGISGRMPSIPAMPSDSASTQQKLKRRASGIPGVGGGKRAPVQAMPTAVAPLPAAAPYPRDHLDACLQRGDPLELRPMLSALEARQEDLAQQIKQMGEELRQLFEPQSTPVVHLAGKRLDRVPYPPDIITASLHTATQQQLEDMASALGLHERSLLQQILSLGVPTSDLDEEQQKILKAAELEQQQERLLRDIMEIDNSIMVF